MEQESLGRRCAALFVTFLKIGAFTFGGGYAMIPLIQRETIESRHWIDDQDLLDMLAIAESTPGTIAVNSARGPFCHDRCGAAFFSGHPALSRGLGTV